MYTSISDVIKSNLNLNFKIQKLFCTYYSLRTTLKTRKLKI